MLEKLKSLQVDRLLNLEEAVHLSAFARALEREYEELSIPEPEWLTKAAAAVREEIARRVHADLMAEIDKTTREIDGYKSAAERRNEATKRLSDLQKRAGLVPARAR